MLKDLPKSMIFQNYKNIDELLEGKDADINRELLNLYRKVAKLKFIRFDPLYIINETWYVTKLVAMQKEPVIQCFYMELEKLVRDDDFQWLVIAFSYYFLRRQKQLPEPTRDFLPEMREFLDSFFYYNSIIKRMNWDMIMPLIDDEIAQRKKETNIDTDLSLKLKRMSPEIIKIATNDFDKERIYDLLRLYNDIRTQRQLVIGIRVSYEQYHGKIISRKYEEDLPL